MDPRPDQELVASYRKGDDDALSVLIRRHTDAVYRFLVRMVGDASTAEDLVQDTFLKAWKHLARFDASKPFKTWIFSIARNAAIDRLRKKDPVAFTRLERDDVPDMSEDIADDRPLPDELLEREDIARELEESLKTIGPKSRSVVLMHETEGMTFQEIADAAGEPLNTVKSRYRRAIATLQSKLTGRPA